MPRPPCECDDAVVAEACDNSGDTDGAGLESCACGDAEGGGGAAGIIGARAEAGWAPVPMGPAGPGCMAAATPCAPHPPGRRGGCPIGIAGAAPPPPKAPTPHAGAAPAIGIA